MPKCHWIILFESAFAPTSMDRIGVRQCTFQFPEFRIKALRVDDTAPALISRVRGRTQIRRGTGPGGWDGQPVNEQYALAVFRHRPITARPYPASQSG